MKTRSGIALSGGVIWKDIGCCGAGVGVLRKIPFKQILIWSFLEDMGDVKIEYSSDSGVKKSSD